MSKLLDLRDLLQGDQPIFGRVIIVAGDMVRVATPAGVVEVTGENGVKNGDAVTIQNGRAVKKSLDGTGAVFLV